MLENQLKTCNFQVLSVKCAFLFLFVESGWMLSFNFGGNESFISVIYRSFKLSHHSM